MASSRLLEETRQAPQAVARALTQDRERFAAFGALLRAQPPRAVLTLARGSSDHAAHYAAYLVMARLGRVPKTADHFEWGGMKFEVVDMDGRRIDKVMVAKTRREGTA